MAELLKPGELAQFRARAAAMKNRAIFRNYLVEKILEASPENILVESESKI